MISGAEAVIRTLEGFGVDTVFGYPGGAIMPVYDAMLDSSVNHTLTRHEQGAAFAAIGYARASGKTGVCIATSGPGATNLLTALADAYMDSVPLVAITGQVPTAAIGTDAFQEIDVLGLSLACTKHSFLVRHADELCDTLQQAFALAAEGRPGPVLVDIPKDIQQGMVEYHPPLTAHSNDSVGIGDFPLEQAHKMLKAAKRPVLYVGGGVGMAGAVEELRQFIATTGMPSVATLKGIGAVAPGTPGYLGMLGMHGTKAANMAVQECDLLIAVGARFDDRVTGRLDTFAPDAQVIHLDIDPAEFSKRKAAHLSHSAGLRQVLPALAMELDCGDWCQRCDERSRKWAFNYDAPFEGIFAPRLLKTISERLPRGSTVACDVGQHQMWVAQHMSFDGPQTHLSSAGLGTMGFGLPVGIGAQFAHPDETVLVVSGDGSFMMNCQELTTIKRAKLPLKILLLDNQRLGMVKQWQELFFEERYSETNLSDNPEFVAMAAAFDIPGAHIWREDQVEEALEKLLNSDGPFLLHVSISEKENVWPLVPPGASNSDMMEKQS
ncbi:acetolactate synthase 2 catalytic subunit [Ferrimonas sediminicola]|uniref:Acetolactate synthase n=1 Tax=Ferrimonas sediminicola TaxID=2569538 RepID=A0A4U1BIT6_9GAMM|nr:acetolactate synthase 2 catalytic subunit [Ferrimonas sediminicola]TKB51035.1 acetolactate synthase 2 catalytic subunit [Ferrimonas sediminicola]